MHRWNGQLLTHLHVVRHTPKLPSRGQHAAIVFDDFVSMDLPRSSCGTADMPSCSPRCSNAASPAVLGRSAAWHLPRLKHAKQLEGQQMHCTIRCKAPTSRCAGSISLRASCAGPSAAPLSLEISDTQQTQEQELPKAPSRRRSGIYAVLCIALLLACTLRSQPGPALASLTISSSTLGKEGVSLSLLPTS